MSTLGPVKAFEKSVATAASETDAIDLGGSYGQVNVGIPTMTSATDIFFKCSDSSDGTYRAIYHPSRVDSLTPTKVNFDSSVTNCFVPIPVRAQFMKICFTSALTDASATFKVICSAN